MSLIYGNGQVIVGPGNSPYVGANGNWWVGLKDLGVHAGTSIHYVTTEEFSKAMDEGIYYVSDNDIDIEQYYINSRGAKYPIMEKNVMVPVQGTNGNWWIGETDLGIPVTGDGSTVAGAAINDDSINGTTTYSSFKIEKLLAEISKTITSKSGKSVEFMWEGTRLGIRIEGETEYVFTDLLGKQGLPGLDGSSVVDAEITPDGNLILDLQDIKNDIKPTSVVTIEDGILTAKELLEMQASISRLTKEVTNIKHGQYRRYSSVPSATDDFVNVLTLSGSGTLQFIISKFTGTVKLSVDGNEYSAIVTDITNQPDYSLISLKPDSSGLFIDSMFADNFTRSLDFTFSKGISLDIKVTDNAEKLYPKILIQGSYFSRIVTPGEGGEGEEDYIPTEPMTPSDIDDIMGIYSVGLI